MYSVAIKSRAKGHRKVKRSQPRSKGHRKVKRSQPRSKGHRKVKRSQPRSKVTERSKVTAKVKGHSAAAGSFG